MTSPTLLTIPQELLELILRLIASKNEDGLIRNPRLWDTEFRTLKGPSGIIYRGKVQSGNPVQLVCRKLYLTAAPIFYASNCFYFRHIVAVRSFAARSTLTAQHIRRLWFNVTTIHSNTEDYNDHFILDGSYRADYPNLRELDLEFYNTFDGYPYRPKHQSPKPVIVF